MPFTNRTKVVLDDNAQYTFSELIELQQAPIDVPSIPGQPPQAPRAYVLHGYGVTKSGLIVEQVLTNPIDVAHVQVLQLRLSTGEFVETTPEQEFFLQLGIPTQAKDLVVGDRPLIQMGGEIEITHIEWVNGTQDVYTLSSKQGNFMLACGLLAACAVTPT